MGTSRAQDVDPGSMVKASLQVIQLIDQGQAGDAWDGASPPVKAGLQRKDFIDAIAKVRGPLGPPKSRQWIDILRQQVTPSGANAKVPPGIYISVVFATAFESGKTANEQVSFHLDDDKVWRLAGYALR